jgi:hypothetical protein
MVLEGLEEFFINQNLTREVNWRVYKQYREFPRSCFTYPNFNYPILAEIIKNDSILKIAIKELKVLKRKLYNLWYSF